MKKIFAIAIAAIAIVACTGQKKAEVEQTKAQQLLSRLESFIKNNNFNN